MRDSLLLLVFSLNLDYVPHHHIDKGILYQAEEDEEGAGGHEHVDGLDVGHGRQ